MSAPLFGQLLSRHVRLSDLDIEEILHEQKTTSRRFGEAAMSLGLASPEHVLRAWVDQLADGPQRVNLSSTGVDARAVGLVPAELARRLGVLPIRATQDVLVLASARDLDEVDVAEVSRTSRRQVRLVLSDAAELNRRLEQYYGSSSVGRANGCHANGCHANGCHAKGCRANGCHANDSRPAGPLTKTAPANEAA